MVQVFKSQVIKFIAQTNHIAIFLYGLVCYSMGNIYLHGNRYLRTVSLEKAVLCYIPLLSTDGASDEDLKRRLNTLKNEEMLSSASLDCL